MHIYFNSELLPEAEQEYVAWVDVMGIGPAMGRSVTGAANFIFKLHAVAAKNHVEGITLYPIMDGFYVATADQKAMQTFLKNVYTECAKEFLSEKKKPQHRFIIRGALAYGPVIHGISVGDDVFTKQGAGNPFGQMNMYKNSIMMGMPMVQAHTHEAKAPPFGLYIHESARTFAPLGAKPMNHVWWKWSNNSSPTWRELRSLLAAHFKWCISNSLSLEYDSERIAAHKNMSEQYMT